MRIIRQEVVIEQYGPVEHCCDTIKRMIAIGHVKITQTTSRPGEVEIGHTIIHVCPYCAVPIIHYPRPVEKDENNGS